MVFGKTKSLPEACDLVEVFTFGKFGRALATFKLQKIFKVSQSSINLGRPEGDEAA